jgi:hypothetical protein
MIPLLLKHSQSLFDRKSYSNALLLAKMAELCCPPSDYPHYSKIQGLKSNALIGQVIEKLKEYQSGAEVDLIVKQFVESGCVCTDFGLFREIMVLMVSFGKTPEGLRYVQVMDTVLDAVLEKMKPVVTNLMQPQPMNLMQMMGMTGMNQSMNPKQMMSGPMSGMNPNQMIPGPMSGMNQNQMIPGPMIGMNPNQMMSGSMNQPQQINLQHFQPMPPPNLPTLTIQKYTLTTLMNLGRILIFTSAVQEQSNINIADLLPLLEWFLKDNDNSMIEKLYEQIYLFQPKWDVLLGFLGGYLKFVYGFPLESFGVYFVNVFKDKTKDEDMKKNCALFILGACEFQIARGAAELQEDPVMHSGLQINQASVMHSGQSNQPSVTIQKNPTGLRWYLIKAEILFAQDNHKQAIPCYLNDLLLQTHNFTLFNEFTQSETFNHLIESLKTQKDYLSMCFLLQLKKKIDYEMLFVYLKLCKWEGFEAFYDIYILEFLVDYARRNGERRIVEQLVEVLKKDEFGRPLFVQRVMRGYFLKMCVKYCQ